MKKLYVVSIATYEQDNCVEPFKPIVCATFEDAVKAMTEDVMGYVENPELIDGIFQYEIWDEDGRAEIIWDDDTVYVYEIFEVDAEV